MHTSVMVTKTNEIIDIAMTDTETKKVLNLTVTIRKSLLDSRKSIVEVTYPNLDNHTRRSYNDPYDEDDGVLSHFYCDTYVGPAIVDVSQVGNYYVIDVEW